MRSAKSKPNAPKTKTAKRKRAASPSPRLPDVSVLSHYNPEDSTASHPDWVKKEFPGYIADHGHHADTGVREFTHNGHVVRIVTTYQVEVDGKPVQAHLSVDEDGKVYTHATPFVSYDSAVELMKAVISAYPDAFSGADDSGSHSGHHQHGEE